MNIKRKRNIICTLFFIIAFFALNKTVFARDLVYEAKLNQEKYLTYANYVKSYSPGDGSIKFNNDDITDNFVSSSSYYKTVGIIFHKKYGSDYSESKRTNDSLIYFDVSNKNLDPLSLGLYRDAYVGKVRGGGTWVGNNSSNDISAAEVIYSIDQNNKPDGSDTLVNIQSKTDSNYFTENRFAIGPNTTENLREALKNSNINIENGFYRIRFSNIISSNNTLYYTAQAMYRYMDNSWEIRNYGKWNKWNNMTNDNPYTHNGTPYDLSNQEWNRDAKTMGSYWFPAGSVLNEYDNELLIPASESQRSVYAIHWIIDENGTKKRFLPEYQEYNKLPSEFETDSNGPKRHWYGWSEKYISNNQLEVYNKVDEINKGENSDYKLLGYEVYEVDENGVEGNIIASGSYADTGMLKPDDPWISFDSKKHNVIFSEIKGAAEVKNYAVHYNYARSNNNQKKVYIGHAYGNKDKNITYTRLKNQKFSGTENLTTSSKKTNNGGDGWLTEYTFNDTTVITNPEITNKSYKLVGYRDARYYFNSSTFRSEYVTSQIKTNYHQYDPKEGVTASAPRTVIIFLYDNNNGDGKTPGDGRDKNPSINVSGWLDFINNKNTYYSKTTSSEYNGDSYAYNNLRTINNNFTNTADIVPSNSELKPYVRTAPFVIQGIRIEPVSTEKKVTSNTCNITVGYSYKVTYSYTNEEGKVMHSVRTENGSITRSYTKDIQVKWWKYKIYNLTMAHISNITIEQDSTAKLFDTLNNKIEIKDGFYKDKVIETEPVIKAYLNNTSLRGSVGTYNSSNEARRAAENEADILAGQQLKISKLEYKINDDKIYINDNYKDILKSKEYKKEINNINGASSYTINNENMGSGTTYDNIIKSYINWNTDSRLKEMTKDSDFKDNYSTVSTNYGRENGVRELTGVIKYTSQNITGSSNYKPTWYSTGNGSMSGKSLTTTINFSNRTTEIELDNSSKNSPKVRLVDVYDPIEFDNWENMVETKDVIDHTLGGGVGKELVLQPNTEFTVTPKFKTKGFANTGGAIDTTINIKECYVIFDFDVLQGGQKKVKGTKIKVNVGVKNTFKTTDDFRDLYSNNNNNIRLIAWSKNATGALENYYKNISVTINKNRNYSKINLSSKSFIDFKFNNLLSITNTGKKDNQKGYITNGVTYSSNHAITTALQDENKNTKNVFRIYDFAVTDCTDLGFKNVFRNTNSTNVNEHNNIAYWSGINKLMVSDDTSNNNIVPRNIMADPDKIGSVPKRIVPLGPYKNTDTTYIKAPKLGYRISFDLKTTGKVSNYNTKKIVIIPRYYFLSKDGKEYTSPEDVKLYYKNNFGKYVELAEYEKQSSNSENYEDYYNSSLSGSQYKIMFTPNDGYRYLRNESITGNNNYLSSKKVQLNMSKIELTSKMMTTDDDYIQAWYGEFKLPNSTIAVKKDGNGKYDLNKPLSNGYIGVIFDIYCVSNEGSKLTLSYSQNNRDDSNNLMPNTSQWDYEGHFGLQNAGAKLSNNLSLQLENGIFQIDDNTYNQIKGTVLLYDADERAANDFN